MKVPASWIFNRLCDEPDRLKIELLRRANNQRGEFGISSISEIVKLFNEIQNWERDVAELRLASSPPLEIVNDFNYVIARIENG